MNKYIEQLINDPPEARWRAVRAFGRADAETVSQTCEFLNELLINDTEGLLSDEMVRERIQLAVKMCGEPSPYEQSERVFESPECVNGSPESVGEAKIPFPVVDFHVHPKRLDDDLLRDFRNANARAVVLATDTDPADIDRAEVVEHIRKTYERSDISRQMGFDFLLEEIRKSLRSVTHYSNQDVLDLVTDYPDVFIGFGSVDLSKDEDYVRETLEWIAANGLCGIKLLPFSQFFDPAESENADIMMEFCAANDLIVLSHTGCSAGVFESPYLNMYSRPSRWRKLAAKYPTVPIVLAHFGAYSAMSPGIWFNEAIDLMAECKNVYADTAAVWRLLWSEEMVRMICENDLMGQVLFGTDYPMPAMIPGGEAGVVMSILGNPILTEKEKRMILSDNALRLLGSY